MNLPANPQTAPADLDSIRQLLQQVAAAVGQSLPELSGAPIAAEREQWITIGDLVTLAEDLIGSSSKRTMQSGWRTLRDGIPDARITGLADRYAHQILPSELTRLVVPIRQRAQQHNARLNEKRLAAGRQQRDGNGDGAVFNAISAWRKLFEIAENDGYIDPGANPAARVRKPRKSQSSRTSIEASQLAELTELAARTGDDPELDLVIVKFHEITGARQEGGTRLCLGDLDARLCRIRLHEKNNQVAWQPVPDWFVQELIAFARFRGATEPGDAVFRKRLRNGTYRPITRRRYNYLFERLQSMAAWIDDAQVAAHVLRHSGARLVERHSGRAVAQRFLRHSPSGVTDIYTRATEAEVAAAVIAIWGGSHPLVDGSGPA